MEQFELIIALLFMFTLGFIVGQWTEFFSNRRKCQKCEYKVNWFEQEGDNDRPEI